MLPNTVLSFENYPMLFSREFGGWDVKSQVFVQIRSYAKLRKHVETVDIGKPRGPGRQFDACGYVLDCIAAAVENGETNMAIFAHKVFKQARDWPRLVADLQAGRNIRYRWLNERHYYSIHTLLGCEPATYPELGDMILDYFRDLKLEGKFISLFIE
jgi:hypothetical protein